MSYTCVYLHYVWTTKNRTPILSKQFRVQLFQHIRQYAKTKKIIIDRINGYHDHVHCLVLLKPGQTIDSIAKLLKGESSHWFNRQFPHAPNLEWQNDYFVASVSISGVTRVRAYIDNQEQHHQRKTFMDEYQWFLGAAEAANTQQRPLRETLRRH